MSALAILCGLSVTAIVVAFLGRRSARLELSNTNSLRANGRARKVGVAMLAGRVETADEDRIVVVIRYPPLAFAIGEGVAAGAAPLAVASARRFWLATDEGVVAVDPLPGTFTVDARDRLPYSTPGTAGSSVVIADGAGIEVEGWLRRERGAQGGAFRGDSVEWAIVAPASGKLRLTDRSLTLSMERRLDRWTLALIVSVIAAVAPVVPIFRAARSVFDGSGAYEPMFEDLAPSVVALAVVAVLLAAAHLRGPEVPWVAG